MLDLRKQLKNERGLTLVELLAVIVILAIIAAIAVPAIGNMITNSKYNAAKADALNVLNAAQMYYLDHPEGENGERDEATVESVSVKHLKDKGYLESIGVFEKVEGGTRVMLATPHKFHHAITESANVVEFAKGKKVDFSNATINDINKDSEKGSKIEGTHKIVE